ncbi:hypothetical protein ACSLV1_26225 [Pseudomonas aeruginosa]|uniref:hypothetical protein n=1 Tax=Pseudomonas aeruginosa TaxID=287 RepID=UPI000F51C8A7|nr:hypothetical protein [Pseudomonas aeruginosa]MBN0030183.1 hypothetical protein [Pseudomonas aeruginosa]MBN0054391.1 hypothetical protein [Pseudomonas aeruginosa]MBN0069493.1 hypothetical protein [Pseudomonas aeruginosa]MBN0105026.1 hypothetical protein [Pseudomonas aeruginosa]MBN0203156.1 hypothetical protein [Pseudomonas aeruginosa]
MKVKDLIAQLSKLDPELLLVGYSEDEDVREAGEHIRLFEITGVTAEQCSRSRDESGKARIELTGSGAGHPVALLELTTDI